MKTSQVRSVISKVKNDLMKKWKQKGGYENFGIKEGEMLRKKFNFNPYGSSEEREIAQMIQGFEDWATNYDGNMREDESVNESINEAVSKTYKIPTQRGTLHIEVEEDPAGVCVDVIFNRVDLTTTDIQFPTGEVKVKQRQKRVKLKESVNEE